MQDKLTNQPRGCAFVSYGARSEAELAIQHLDKQAHLPGALCPLEVRHAAYRAGQFAVPLMPGRWETGQGFVRFAGSLIQPSSQQLRTPAWVTWWAIKTETAA